MAHGATQGPWWRSALLSSLAGLALSGTGVAALLGLPGALALTLAMPAITAIYGVTSGTMFPGDSAWPFAILVTLLLGPLVPILWLGTRALGWRGWPRAIGVALGMAVGSALVALLTYALGVAALLA